MARLQLHIDTIPPRILSEPLVVAATLAELGGGGESPRVTVHLDPGRGALVALLDPPPLRARARLTDRAGERVEGVVQAVTLGARPAITLEC